jgi:glycosyltransferase involved in cell wall biosynthesis
VASPGQECPGLGRATTGTNACPPQSPIRLVIQQPALPRYRVPVFRELARRPGIRLTLFWGDHPTAPKERDVTPDGFRGSFVPMRQLPLGREVVLWHQPQWQYASRRDADVLLLSWDVHYASLVPALLRARANGVPTILWGHGYSKTGSRLRSWPRDKVAELATALLFYNYTTAQRFAERGWDARRVFVAPNALDPAPVWRAKRHWLADPARLEAFKWEHDLLRGPVVLFVSRLDRERRVDLLLEAVRRLAATYPSIRLVLIGKGPHGDALRRQVDSMGLAQHIRFVGAVYDEMKLAPWFLSADAFCFPNNVGLSLLHAFAYGLPVVTSNNVEAHGPEAEALVHGENGLLYEDGDAGSLAGALRTLFEDRDAAARMSRRAAETVEKKYNLMTMVDGMESAVRYCADQSARRRA